MSDGAHDHPALAELADQVGSVGGALLAVDGRITTLDGQLAETQLLMEGIAGELRGLGEQIGAVGRELVTARLEVAQLAGRLDELTERHAPTLVGAATHWVPSWAEGVKAWEGATGRPLLVERMYHGGQPTAAADTGLARAAGRHVWLSYKPRGAASAEVDKTRAFLASVEAAGRTPADLTISLWHEPVDNMGPEEFRARHDAHAGPWRERGYNVVPIFTNWSITRPDHDALTRYWPQLATGVGVDHYYGDGTGGSPHTALAKVAGFARERGLRLYIGEFGVPVGVTSDGNAAAWLDQVRIFAKAQRVRLMCYWNVVRDDGYDTRLDDRRPLTVAAFKRLWDGLG